MNGTLTWVCALFVYPLLVSDARSPVWSFALGVELAVGLYFLLMILTETFQ